MPQQTVDIRSSPMVWQAEILRLTAFPSAAAQIAQPTWWSDLVGEPPEARISRPRKEGLTEQGPFKGRKLVLGIEPTRIDWLLVPADDQGRGVESLPTIGPVREALDIFSPLMRRWFELESCPPVQRLAFGAILRQPVNDQQSGYRQISAYLPFVKLDAENSSDFSYQINRPRVSTSGFAELKINRLSKWSVVAGQSIQFAVGLTSARYLPGRAYFACHLEVDINTAAEFQGELPRDQLPQIFQELVDLGIEIAREGDIP